MRWLRSKALRWTLAIVLVLGLFSSVFVLFAARTGHQAAGDARSTRANGNAAIAALLRDEGVSVRPRDRVDRVLGDIDGDETLVVTNSGRLDQERARQLVEAGPAVLVLLTPNSTALRNFDLPLEAHPLDQARARADCGIPAGQRAESITIDHGFSYTSQQSAESCFPSGSGHVHQGVTDPATGTRIVVIGINFSNRIIADDGNAAYAMNVLGGQPEVAWLVAGHEPSAGTGADDTAPTLLPSWWLPAVAQLLVALVIIAVWRGRRLGPLMSENLPVVIPASETVEGHGRLYERLHAREQAAAALRSGARTRLARRLGHADDPQALSQVVAERTGRDLAAVHWLLAGPPPEGDTELHVLNQQLTALEQEAREP